MQLIKLDKNQFPKKLLEITDQPEQLYIEGTMIPEGNKVLCVVGSRKNTHYGKDTCEKLIASLKGKPVSIISGLAIGIDTIAHKAALAAGLHTLAVPGSGLNRNVLYPHSNRNFADEIIHAGGGLLSEFEPDFISTVWAFPMRNRIMAALADAVLIIEAERKSGTLITSKLATQYNRDVLTIPGSIYSKNSEGPHMLLRLGATPITCPEDLHEALGFQIPNLERTEKNYDDCSPEEIKILELLQDSMTRDELIRTLDLPISKSNVLISLLEIKGYVKESLGQLHLFS